MISDAADHSDSQPIPLVSPILGVTPALPYYDLKRES